MSALEKPKERAKWRLTLGTSTKLYSTYSGAQNAACNHLLNYVQLASKTYTEDYAALTELRKEIGDLKMTEGMKEWSFQIGPAKGTMRIEKVG